MTSFAELSQRSGPVLVLDTASVQTQLATLSSNSEIRACRSDRESGVGIFACLAELGLDLAEIGSFVFCEGPGSILGIRTAAMALRTWNLLRPRPTFSYRSLEILATARALPDITYIVDARRERWHAQKMGGDLQRVVTGGLTGPLATPDKFRAWMKPPENTLVTEYDLAGLMAKTLGAQILRESPCPDAYLVEEPAYATWQPQVHRAP